MASMLVIGIGRFGRHLATRLCQLGNEVMVVDRDEAAVSSVAPLAANALIGDCMDEEVIRSWGVNNFDVCFVCISDNFQSSLEITSLLKEAGARMVVSKTDRELHAKFLTKIGPTGYPSRAGHGVAHRHALQHRGRFRLHRVVPGLRRDGDGSAQSLGGHTLSDLQVRTRYQVNVIGIKEGSHVRPVVDAGHRFVEGEHILVAGSQEAIRRL